MNAPYMNLINTADEIVCTEATRDSDGRSIQYQSIPEHEQDALCAALIDADDRDLFSLYENDNYDSIVASLLTMLKKGTEESVQEFATVLKDSIRDYYAKRAQQLLDERCGEMDERELNEHGRYSYTDRQTGERRTARFGG